MSVSIVDNNNRADENGLIIDKGRNELAHGVVINANQELFVSGQSKSNDGGTFMLLYIDTGKSLSD